VGARGGPWPTVSVTHVPADLLVALGVAGRAALRDAFVRTHSQHIWEFNLHMGRRFGGLNSEVRGTGAGTIPNGCWVVFCDVIAVL
jgi:hypothetical protein